MGLFGNKPPTASPSEPPSTPLPDQAKKTEPNAVAATTTAESSPETQTASILAVLRRQKAETPTPNSSPPSRSPSGASKTDATVSSSSPSTVVSKRKESAHSPSTAPIVGETPTRGISKWFQRGSRNRTSIQEELVASSTEIPRIDKCKKTDSKGSVDQPSGSKSDFVTLPKTESGEVGSTSVTDKPPRYSYEASPQPKSKKSSKASATPSAAATPPTPVKSTAQQKAVTLPAEASTVPTTKDPPGTDANEDEMSTSAACDPAELEEGGPNAIPPTEKAAGVVKTAVVNDGDDSSSVPEAERNSGCLLTKPNPAKQRNSSLARPPAFPNIGGDAARMGMVRRATFNLSDTEYTSDMITVTKSKKSDCWSASDASPIPIQSNITYACAGFSPAGPDAELRKALAMRKQMTMSKEKAWMDVGKQT